jgi:predicted DNA-binding transcriptional regulator AlpA
MLHVDHMEPALNAINQDQSRALGTLPAALQDSALIDIKVVGALLGLKSPTSVRVRIGGPGGLPEPIRLSSRCSRWRVSDIRAYIETQAQAAKREPA